MRSVRNFCRPIMRPDCQSFGALAVARGVTSMILHRADAREFTSSRELRSHYEAVRSRLYQTPLALPTLRATITGRFDIRWWRDPGIVINQESVVSQNSSTITIRRILSIVCLHLGLPENEVL